MEDINLAIASSIDYVFNNKAYAKFLKSVVDFGINDFLLTEIILPKTGKIFDIKIT
jgi:hypothetical protein